MFHRFLPSLCLGSLFLLSQPALAEGPNVPAADLASSKDHPALKRYEGSKIVAYSHQDYASYELALGKGLNPAAPASAGKSFEKEEKIEGTVTRISYIAPAGRSSLEVFRNYESELKEKGFEVVFKAEEKETGYRFGRRYAGVFGQIFEYNDDGNYYVVARKESTTVALYVVGYQMGLAGGLKPIKGQPLVQLDVIGSKVMDEKMVVVSSEKMADSITGTGRIALYGIHFDTDKTDIKADSAPTLEQIAKLLRENASMKLYVVGHTDNQGTYDYNLDLSKRRASAVVSELSGKHGIEASRLTPLGASCIAPVSSNRAEDGRAKNRRVELVER